MCDASPRSSVLSRLANPLAYAILPSRRSYGADASESMPPPGRKRPRPPADAHSVPATSSSSTALALPSAHYLAALDAIIERDFFPDLRRLRGQLAWLDAHAAGDARALIAMEADVTESVRRALAPVSATPTGRELFSRQVGDETPSRVSLHTGVIALDAAASQRGGCGASVNPIDTLRLDAFQRAFRGADAVSFAQNVAARISNLRARAWWLHTAPIQRAGAALSLTDAPPPLWLVDDVNRQGVATRSSVIGARRWRPKNSLFFPPTLESTACASGVPTALLLADRGEKRDDRGGDTRAAAALSSHYSGLDLAVSNPVGLRAPAQVHHAATRLRGSEVDALLLSSAALAPLPAQPRIRVLGAGARSSYDFIPTPQIFPSDDARVGTQGTIGVTPLVTWGELLATPSLLPNPHPQPPLSAISGGGGGAVGESEVFHIRAQPSRELLRNALVSRAAGAADARTAAAQWDRRTTMTRVSSAALAPAAADARRGVTASVRVTPAFAAAMTPSFLVSDAPAHVLPRGGAALSVVSAATSARGSSIRGGRHATRAVDAAAALASLPPAARGIALAAARAAQSTGVSAGGLSGVLKKSRRVARE